MRLAHKTMIVSSSRPTNYHHLSVKKEKIYDAFPPIEGRFLTRGRPLGRKVECKSNCLTVDSTHSKSPNGHPRFTQSRTAASSFFGQRWIDSFDPAEGGEESAMRTTGLVWARNVQSSAKLISNATVPFGKPIRLAAQCVHMPSDIGLQNATIAGPNNSPYHRRMEVRS